MNFEKGADRKDEHKIVTFFLSDSLSIFSDADTNIIIILVIEKCWQPNNLLSDTCIYFATLQ